MCSWLRIPRERENVGGRVATYRDFTPEGGRMAGADGRGKTISGQMCTLTMAWSSLTRALQLESTPAAQKILSYYQFLVITLFYAH